MTETTKTTVTFEDAFQWAFSNAAIIRFFEDADTKTRQRPSVRITVISDLDREGTRYVAVVYTDSDLTEQEAFIKAVIEVKEKYEVGEAEIVAKREKAQRPKLRLA